MTVPIIILTVLSVLLGLFPNLLTNWIMGFVSTLM